MKSELNFKIGAREVKCILLNGFQSNVPPTKTLHRHNYTEVHIISGDRVSFELENRIMLFSGSCIFAVPAGQLHCFPGDFENVCHSAFLIELSLEEFVSKKISDATSLSFFEALDGCSESSDYTKIAAYFAIFCNDLFCTEPLNVTPITDPAFIINDFLSMNYNKEVGLADLAAELHYSEKQTERLIKKHTGLTFKQAIVGYRMALAQHLMKTTNLPLSEIAQRVGYRSYNGFRQAYKQFGKQ